MNRSFFSAFVLLLSIAVPVGSMHGQAHAKAKNPLALSDQISITAAHVDDAEKLVSSLLRQQQMFIRDLGCEQPTNMSFCIMQFELLNHDQLKLIELKDSIHKDTAQLGRLLTKDTDPWILSEVRDLLEREKPITAFPLIDIGLVTLPANSSGKPQSHVGFGYTGARG